MMFFVWIGCLNVSKLSDASLTESFIQKAFFFAAPKKSRQNAHPEDGRPLITKLKLSRA
jgi:hypothetical protein